MVMHTRRIRKASVFLFPTAVTPPHPSHIHQDDEREHAMHSAKRATRGRCGVYKRTFNEWMNLISSWTRRGGASLTYRPRESPPTIAGNQSMRT
ncbi:hypothetical protein BC628DRAFT_1376506 [Trametes gibbosa]|nr:hypothetical protein BC628DRAFT_1376506 [Trametes gibbosa]